MNKLLPRTNVNWGAAILGAMVTGFLLEAVKFAFVTYAQKIMFESYSGVYGPVGLIPLVLVWIYTSWLLVLLGAEIAHSMQNLQLLEAEDRRQRGEEPINGLLAAQLLAAVAGAHETGGVGLPKEKLATDFGLTPDIIERIVARLKARGLIAEVHGDINGYIPGRAADSHHARRRAERVSLDRHRDRARRDVAGAARAGRRSRREPTQPHQGADHRRHLPGSQR